MMWAIIPSWLKFAAGGLLMVILASSASYWIGKRDGRQDAATDALEATVELFQSREKVNATISSADAAALCDHFGLQSDDKRECMRRLADAHADAGNCR